MDKKRVSPTPDSEAHSGPAKVLKPTTVDIPAERRMAFAGKPLDIDIAKIAAVFFPRPPAPPGYPDIDAAIGILRKFYKRNNIPMPAEEGCKPGSLLDDDVNEADILMTYAGKTLLFVGCTPTHEFYLKLVKAGVSVNVIDHRDMPKQWDADTLGPALHVHSQVISTAALVYSCCYLRDLPANAVQVANFPAPLALLSAATTFNFEAHGCTPNDAKLFQAGVRGTPIDELATVILGDRVTAANFIAKAEKMYEEDHKNMMSLVAALGPASGPAPLQDISVSMNGSKMDVTVCCIETNPDWFALWSGAAEEHFDRILKKKTHYVPHFLGFVGPVDKDGKRKIALRRNNKLPAADLMSVSEFAKNWPGGGGGPGAGSITVAMDGLSIPAPSEVQ